MQLNLECRRLTSWSTDNSPNRSFLLHSLPREESNTSHNSAPITSIRHRANALGDLPRSPRGKRKIAILSYNNGRVDHKILSDANLTRMIRCNHQAYADMHGYDYISPKLDSALWSASRFVLNGLRYKTFSILSHFEQYDALVWIDHDALFFNMNVSVEYWMDEVMDLDSDILMAEDLPGYRFNAGLQIVRTTTWARMFYESAISDILKTPVESKYLEQPIFYRLHDTVEGAKKKIQIHHPRREFQAFLKVESDFTNSSWVVHGTFCDTCDLRKYMQPPACTTPSGAGLHFLLKQDEVHHPKNNRVHVPELPSGRSSLKSTPSQISYAHDTTVRERPPMNTAVCISGEARTFAMSLSMATIEAALNGPEEVSVDVFCYMTNSMKGDWNSKGKQYDAVDDLTIQFASNSLTRHSKLGNCVLRRSVSSLKDQISSCNFGSKGEKMFDLSNETVAVRQGLPLLKRHRCFQLVLEAERMKSAQTGVAWTYDTVMSLRPDVFFFRPLTYEHFVPRMPIFPAPAHTAPAGAHIRGFPNDHIAILPRFYADRYFNLAKTFTNCTGGGAESPYIVDLIAKYFSVDEMDITSVVPYILNRPGRVVDHCERVAYYALNIGEGKTKVWKRICHEFISWFLSERERNSTQVLHFWQQFSGEFAVN